MIGKLKNYWEIFIIFLLSLTPVLWLKDNEIILGHDAGFRLNFIEYFLNLFFSWSPVTSLGIDTSIFKGFLVAQFPEVFFTLITGSLTIGQRLTFVFWFFVMGISMYVFIKHFYPQEKFWIFRLFSSIFYIYNFFLLQGWFIVERAKFSLYAALPLGLLIIYRLLNKEYSLIKGTIIFSFVFFFLNGGGNPTLYGALILVYFITFLYLTSINCLRNGIKEVIYSIKVAFSLVVGITLINAYWIFPQVYLSSNKYVSSLSSLGGISGILAWENVVNQHASFINLFRLQGIPDWYNNINHAYATYFVNNPILIFLSLAPICVILLGLIFYKTFSVKDRNDKLFYLVFLFFIIGIIFTAGSRPPFGLFYIFLIEHVPGFAIFRSSFYKFGSAFWFSVIFLTGYLLNLFLMKFEKKGVLYLLLGVIALIFIVSYHFPYFTSNFFVWNFPFSTKVKVPDYVYQMGDYIKHTSSGRILLLPEFDSQFNADAYSWGFWSLDPLPSLFTNKSIIANTTNLPPIINSIYTVVNKGDESSFLRLIGAAGIDRILWRDDILFSDKKTGSRYFLAIKKKLENLKGVKVEKQVGFWTLYKVESSYYLPLFYAPHKLVYSYSNPSFIEKIFDKNGQKSKVAILFADSLINKNRQIFSLLDENLIEAECVLCEVGRLNIMESEVKIPDAKLLPDSRFYFLIASKEQKIFNMYKNSPPQRIDANFSFASKRLAEIGTIASRDYKKDNSEYLIEKNIRKYRFLINDILTQSRKLPKETKNPILIKILAFLRAHYRYFAAMNNKHGLAEDSLGDLSVFMRGIINNLIEKEIWMTNFLDNQIGYTFNIKNPGNYDLHIEPRDTQLKKVLIDDQEVTNSNNYLSLGLHKLNLIYPIHENLLMTYDATNSGELVLGFDKGIRFGIKNHQDKNTYLVDFDYKLISGRPNFSIVEQKKNGKNIRSFKLKQNGIWNNFNYLFEPKEESKQVYLQFALPGFDLEAARIEIKNFNILKLKTPIPKVFLYQKLERGSLSVPNITFQKINPTRYRVYIENADAPFLLNFGETYDQEWKAYILKDQFNELEAKNKLINKNFILAPFAKSVGEDNHIKTNGYSNGWFIDKKGNYEIMIEYSPQSIFYLGMVISGSTVAVSLFVLFMLRRRNSEKN